MDPTSRPRRAPEPKSGGKMVRPRRTVGPRTPYERPRIPNYSGPENPNWISRLILSPTRMIATGTGKLFSSVFGSDSSDDDDSSSSSAASDSSSEDEIDDDNNDNDIASQGADRMETKNGTSIVWKSETKHMIEQLLMQETFSREECDRLTSIIRSRVVDCLDTEDGRLSEIRNRTVGNDVTMPDLCSTAVMEAKKWFEEKKSGSNSKSELDLGICTLNSAMLPHVADGEVGSPVDVAKSYMQMRPPWASPCVNHIEFKSPSLTGTQLFKEGTPYSIGVNSMSSSKLKRDSSATGSWNILEEIRKVRSKATEEMLKSRPSSKINWSAFASEHKSSPNSFAADKLEAAVGDQMVNSAKSVDTSLNFATGVTSTDGFPVLQMTQDGLQDEASPPNPTTFISEQNQDLEANRIIEGTEAGAADVDGHKDTNGTTKQLSSMNGGSLQDSRLLDKNCSASKEVAGTGGAVATNGLPSSGSSLSAGLDREQTARPPDEDHNQAVSSHDKINTSVAVETCELLSEASIEVPIMNANDSIPTGSQNSSSMHNEGLSQALTRPNSKRSLAAKTSSVGEKQQGRKISRYNRKGRGRGK